MTQIEFPLVPVIDRSLEVDIQIAIDSKTKPVGALGQLESIAKQIALIQQTLTPVAEDCELFIFAADHGVARAGVSAYPPEVTKQMVLNFLEGGAAANVFSRQNHVSLRVVDAGVSGAAIEHPGLVSRRIAAGTQNFLEQPAMSSAELEQTLESGIALGLEAMYEFVAFGEMGIGNTSSASMIAHKLGGYPLSRLVGRGTGLDDAGLAQKLALLEQASERVPAPVSAMTCLREFGGFEIAMMSGAMIGAASRGCCLLVDGFIATAAYLAAAEFRPEIREYAIFCHQSAEPGHRLLLEGLEVDPLIKLDLRLGEGTGALLAWPVIQSAIRMLAEMASFKTAGVSEKL